jgi:hypothetical protein
MRERGTSREHIEKREFQIRKKQNFLALHHIHRCIMERHNDMSGEK